MILAVRLKSERRRKSMNMNRWVVEYYVWWDILGNQKLLFCDGYRRPQLKATMVQNILLTNSCNSHLWAYFLTNMGLYYWGVLSPYYSSESTIRPPSYQLFLSFFFNFSFFGRRYLLHARTDFFINNTMVLSYSISNKKNLSSHVS